MCQWKSHYNLIVKWKTFKMFVALYVCLTCEESVKSCGKTISEKR